MTISHCLVYWRRVPHWHRKCVRAPLHEEKLHLEKKICPCNYVHTHTWYVYICLSHILIIYIYPYVSPWCIPQLAHGFGSHMFLAALSGVWQRPSQALYVSVALQNRRVSTTRFIASVGIRWLHRSTSWMWQWGRDVYAYIHIYIYTQYIYICMIYAAYLIQSYTIYRERERATGRNLEYRHFFQNVWPRT